MKWMRLTAVAAWLPLTPRGVVAVARTGGERLLVLQLIVALLGAAGMGWFFHATWFPVIREAAQTLPAQGSLHGGHLVWEGDSPVRLAANRFLSLGVDLWSEGDLGNESDLSVEFGRAGVRLRSLLGYVQFEYPREWNIAANQTELVPWWGAWAPWLLLGLMAATGLGLLVSWVVLATLYCLPVRLVAFFANRHLDLAGSWRLAAAALLPGALFQTVAILAYGAGLLDLPYLGWSFIFHFIIGWIYAMTAASLLPRDPGTTARKKNPFRAES
jgi:hypothetical protein